MFEISAGSPRAVRACLLGNLRVAPNYPQMIAVSRAASLYHLEMSIGGVDGLFSFFFILGMAKRALGR